MPWFLSISKLPGQSCSSQACLYSKRQLCTYCTQAGSVTQHVSSGMCPVLCCVFGWGPTHFLTIHPLHRANFTFTYFVDPLRPQNSRFNVSCFVFDWSPLSTPRSCCVSSSFWRSTWKVPAPAAGSRPQRVQACCPSWWTHCPPGRWQMCWWCRWASLTTVSLRATTIASSW